MKKLKVGVIFGGQSGEHEVSLMSATSVINVMNKDKYDIIPIGITKDGKWHVFSGDISKIMTSEWEQGALPAFLPPDPSYKCIISREQGKEIRYYLDVIFPVLHGPRGEDGTVQGVFELMNIPYVGCGVTSSALCMDKAVAKKVLRQEGISVVDFEVLYKRDLEGGLDDIVSKLTDSIGFPCFVKPANLGSSVGISKARNAVELSAALIEASLYDSKIIVEKAVDAREIECSVLGNDFPEASLPGEIIPSRDFYDYTAKYFDGDNSKLLLPAPMANEKTEEIRDLAVKAFKALGCCGMARVDFLCCKVTGINYINELNTIPGFTRISMYPKMWEATGLSYKDLVDKLIELALEKHREKNTLKLS